MSAESTVLTPSHFEYIARHTRPEDDFLRHLKAAAVEAGIPAIWISPEQASFMQIQLKLIGAFIVLDVGTLAGYSAIAMARALPESGRVHTIEINDRFADFAQEWIDRSNVAGRISLHRGPAAEVLPRFEPNSADAAFIDADKTHYQTYLEQCLRIVRHKGLIMVDNAFAFGQLFDENPTDPEAPAVKAFNDHMAKVVGVHSIIVPLGDGCWVGVKE